MWKEDKAGYRPIFVLTLSLALFLSVLPLGTRLQAASLSVLVRGRILLDVQQNGEAWYVDPVSLKRYFLGRPDDAVLIMRELALGITTSDLVKIPTEANEVGEVALQKRLAGRILLAVEQHGELWYVDPVTLTRHYLGRPRDALMVMTEFGLGITSENLAKIPIASAVVEPLADTRTLTSSTLTIPQGSFPIHVITLRRDAYRMVTDTAEAGDCESDCAAESLRVYAQEHGAVAGIHGTYFCPPDYAACADKVNTFLSPVYNSDLDIMINEAGLRFFHRPLLTSDNDGDLHYYHRADTAPNLDVSAAIGNWPSLIEDGNLIVGSEPSEAGFLTKSVRGGIGYNEENVYLVVAERASVTDLAYIFASLGATSAMNLDGGGSATLFMDGAYVFGPGRLLPNAILFVPR